MVKFLLSNISQFHYQLIPSDTINLLIDMLAVHPDDRPHITKLVPNLLPCPYPLISLSRGPIYFPNKITSNHYYILVDWLIDVTKLLKLKPKTLIASIDLLERYLANYSETLENFQLLGCTIMFVVSKMLEIYAPETSDFIYISAKSFNAHQLIEKEVELIHKMNYSLISCDIDDYVNMLVKYPGSGVYAAIKKVYQSIKMDQKYAGSLSYAEIMDYFSNI